MEKPYGYYLKNIAPRHKGFLFSRRPAIKLIDKLQRKRVLYLTAPLGYGKTAAVLHWLHKTNHMNAWLTVDSRDADGLEFCRGLILTLAKAFDDNETLRAVVEGTDIYNLSLPCAYAAFAAIRKPSVPFVLIIDDFHMAINKNTIDILNNLIARLPDNCYILLLSDDLPGPETEKFFKKTIVAWLKADKIKLTAADTQTLLTARGFSVDREQAEAIANKTDGCPLLLNLLTESDFEATGFDIEALIRTRVIEPMDEERLLFHAQASLAAVIDPESAQFLTGNAESLAELDALADETGLVLKLENGFYRYHPLLSSALYNFLAQQDPSISYNIYRKLSEWAYRHKNYIEAAAYDLLIGEPQPILQYIQELSSADAANYGLSAYAAQLRALLLDAPMSDELLKQPLTIAYFAFTAFLAGDYDSFIRWSEAINDQSPFSRFAALLNPLKPIQKVMAAFRRSNRESNTWTQPPSFFSNFLFNATTFHNGLIDFSEITQKGFDIFTDYPPFWESLWQSAAPVYMDLIRAGICFEKKQLDTAMDYALSAQTRLDKNTLPEITVGVYMMLGELYDHLHAMEEYKAAVKAAEECIYEHGLYYLLPNFRAATTSKLILYGNKNALGNWLEKTAPALSADVNFYTYRQHIVSVRCLTATARFKDALLLLQKIEAYCAAFQRKIDLIQVNILISINYWNLDQKEKAMDAMAEALSIGQKYDYIIPFSREARDISPILKKIVNKISRGGLRNIEKRYIKSILIHTNTHAQQSSTVGMTSLSGLKPKKLSKQQTLMLHYLAQGMSYMDICNETGLKITSVREHITKLYDKLSVHNSAEMLKRAKELDLI